MAFNHGYKLPSDRRKAGWHYSLAFGVMYGSVPVGLLIASPILIGWLLSG
jgi:hypothetical protein